MNHTTIVVLVGSLRAGSLSRKVAVSIAALAPSGMRLVFPELGTLALYNEDLEETPPREWARFREEVKSGDAVLFVTPEYNRSVPAVLKNAIDVGSRPYGKSVWARKPAAVISVSPGLLGGFGANHHLRQSLVFLDMPTLQQPEAYVGNAKSLFNQAGELTDPRARELLQSLVTAFAGLIARST